MRKLITKNTSLYSDRTILLELMNNYVKTRNIYYHLINNHSYEHGREASGGKILWISSYRNDCETAKRKMEFNYKKAKQKYEVVHLMESDKINKVFLE